MFQVLKCEAESNSRYINVTVVAYWYDSCIFTWEEGEHHWHPANDIGPGEPPVSVAFPVVVNSHTSVHCHRKKH